MTLIRGLTDVDSTARFALGTRHEDGDGNVFIYLQGLNATVAGTLVTYYITSTAAAVTAILASGGVGLVAIAMAAITTGKFGWYLIAGDAPEAIVTDVDYSVTTLVTEAIGVAFVTTGAWMVARGGGAVAVNDIVRNITAIDFSDGKLLTAKGTALAADDLFVVSNVGGGTEAIVYVPPDCAPGGQVYAAVVGAAGLGAPVCDTPVALDLIPGAVFSVEEVLNAAATARVAGMTINYPSISGVLDNS